MCILGQNTVIFTSTAEREIETWSHLMFSKPHGLLCGVLPPLLTTKSLVQSFHTSISKCPSHHIFCMPFLLLSPFSLASLHLQRFYRICFPQYRLGLVFRRNFRDIQKIQSTIFFKDVPWSIFIRQNSFKVLLIKDIYSQLIRELSVAKEYINVYTTKSCLKIYKPLPLHPSSLTDLSPRAVLPTLSVCFPEDPS